MNTLPNLDKFILCHQGKLHAGIVYFSDPETAAIICREIIGRKDYWPRTCTRFPQARVVNYTRGAAIQYAISGAYFPELETVRDWT